MVLVVQVVLHQLDHRETVVYLLVHDFCSFGQFEVVKGLVVEMHEMIAIPVEIRLIQQIRLQIDLMLQREQLTDPLEDLLTSQRQALSLFQGLA